MKANPRVVLPLCLAVGVLEGYDIQIIGVAAPQMAPALGLGPGALGWIFFASNLGLMLGAMTGGWLADRAGRRPVFAAAILTFGIFTLATVGVHGAAPLIAVRFLAGLGLGAGLTNMVAIAADVAAPHRRAVTTSLLFCGVPFGGALVAITSQALPGGYDWRTLFTIGGLIPLALAVAAWLVMVETRSTELVAQPRVATMEALFGEGRRRSTLLLWLALAPTLLVLYLMLYWLPTLVVAKELPAAIAPRAAIAFNLAGILGAIVIGALTDRLEARSVISAAFLGVIATSMLFIAVRDETMIFVLSGVAGFLILGANYALYGLIAAYYPESARATGTGTALGVGRIGSLVGPVLPGIVLGAGAGVQAALLLLIPASAVACLAVALLSRPGPARADVRQ